MELVYFVEGSEYLEVTLRVVRQVALERDDRVAEARLERFQPSRGLQVRVPEDAHRQLSGARPDLRRLRPHPVQDQVDDHWRPGPRDLCERARGLSEEPRDDRTHERRVYLHRLARRAQVDCLWVQGVGLVRHGRAVLVVEQVRAQLCNHARPLSKALALVPRQLRVVRPRRERAAELVRQHLVVPAHDLLLRDPRLQLLVRRPHRVQLPAALRAVRNQYGRELLVGAAHAERAAAVSDPHFRRETAAERARRRVRAVDGRRVRRKRFHLLCPQHFVRFRTGAAQHVSDALEVHRGVEI